MTYELEDGIPVPSRAGGAPMLSRYPLTDMKEGQSFVCPFSESDAVRSAIQRLSSKTPAYKFLTRKEGNNLRVWCDKRPAE